MKYYKKFEHGMWHIHAFEADGSQDAFISDDLIPVTNAEAEQIRTAPISEEYKRHLEEGAQALGGRGIAIYPPKEYKEAIGHVCANSAHMEVVIRTTLWHVAGVGSTVGLALTGEMRLHDLLKVTETLCETRMPHLSGRARELCNKARKLYEERNKYVHRIWLPGKDGAPIVSKAFMARSHAHNDEQPVTLDMMYTVAEGFLQIASEVHLLFFNRSSGGPDRSPL